MILGQKLAELLIVYPIGPSLDTSSIQVVNA